LRARGRRYDGPYRTVSRFCDLILLKLIAGRPRDYGDIEDIFFVQGQLDESYLRRWAAPLGITDRLEQALRDAKEQKQ
jgi:hypothetical protein